MFSIIWKVTIIYLGSTSRYHGLESAPSKNLGCIWGIGHIYLKDHILYCGFHCLKNDYKLLSSFIILIGFPGDSDGKESACNAGDLGFDPYVEKIPWRREWLTTLVFLPGKSQGQRSLQVYCSWDCKELDMTEWVTLSLFIIVHGRRINPLCVTLWWFLNLSFKLLDPKPDCLKLPTISVGSTLWGPTRIIIILVWTYSIGKITQLTRSRTWIL